MGAKRTEVVKAREYAFESGIGISNGRRLIFIFIIKIFGF